MTSSELTKVDDKRSGTIIKLLIAAAVVVLIFAAAVEAYDQGTKVGYSKGLTDGQGETLLQAGTYLALSPGQEFTVSYNMLYGNLTFTGSGGFEVQCFQTPCGSNLTVELFFQHGFPPPYNSSYVRQGYVNFTAKVNSGDGLGTYVVVKANPSNTATAYVFWTTSLIVKVTGVK